MGPVRPSEEPADGTWREEGRHIIINLHGQEMKLVRESAPREQAGTPTPTEPPSGGTVYGRLLNQSRPLVSCQVRIVPLAKGFTGYSVDRAGQSFTTTTDGQGAYRFENVPAGAYKLSWLPDGTNQWIRRISMRPDVMAQAEKAARAKDIRTALRTIN